MRTAAYLALGLSLCLLLAWVVWIGLDANRVAVTEVPGPVAEDLSGTGLRRVEEQRVSIGAAVSGSARADAGEAEAPSFAERLDREVAAVLAEFGPAARSAGGLYGGRVGGSKRLRGKRRVSAKGIERGLEWLVAHQSPDGRWDCDGFMRLEKTGVPCDGGGAAAYDVGVTALALLAVLGDGHTVASGKYSATARNAVVWLESQQAVDGRIGNASHHDFIYGHAIATLAMCEAYGMSRTKVLEQPAQRALDYLESHRRPRFGWRYFPNAPDSDVSITIWGLMAYRTARDFRLKVPAKAFVAMGEFLDSVTDRVTGRLGYTRPGESASRRTREWTWFPAAKTESLTAIGLFGRFFLGQSPRHVEVMIKAADTIMKRPIAWTPDAGNIDCYYWWFGTQAVYQMGPPYWDEWQKQFKALVRHQRRDGNAAGSWDPKGVWGRYGGRVATTALLVMTLEAYYRHTRMVRWR